MEHPIKHGQHGGVETGCHFKPFKSLHVHQITGPSGDNRHMHRIRQTDGESYQGNIYTPLEATKGRQGESDDNLSRCSTLSA
ncbi:uncharacterized protein LOC144180153 isoform X2 [Haemaphysalis longicornis]